MAKSILILIGILLILSIPVILWSLPIPLSSRFTNLSSSFTALGQILGILGMNLFALTLILNTRHPLLEKLFGGLNKVFPIHHILGGTTLILLLFHPLSLTVRYLSISVEYAALFLLPGNVREITYGIIALDLLIALLILTFFIKLPYHIWKNTHRLLGISFLFASLHIFSINSDISFNQPLRIYMMFVSLAGISAYTYRTIFPKFFVKRYKYFVEKIHWLNKETVELILAPKAKKINFVPGQFVFIEFSQAHLSEQHPFSITSSPLEKNLRLVIKVLGDYTGKLKELPLNTLAYIEGPYGKFNALENPNKNQIWIAGGIGITPFLSMARSLKPHFPKIDLFYSVKNKEEAVFFDELKQLSTKNKNLRFFPWFSESQGRLNAEIINKLSSNIEKKEIFICGPIPMIKSLKKQFLESGIKEEKLHSEEFELV